MTRNERHIRGLGYIRMQSQDLSRWRELTVDALGFQEVAGPDPDSLHLRMDERAARLVVSPGAPDRVLAIGWEVRDHLALAAVTRDLEAAAVAVKPMTAEEKAERRVEDGITFTDPGGIPTEIFFAPELDHSPVLTGLAQRFVTGDQGLGHVVVPTMAPEESLAFYTEVLGFLNRGAMKAGPPTESGYQPRVRFMGVNERHHSLALIGAPRGEVPGVVHFMVEVDTLDAVGRALDRVDERGFSLSSTLGRHTNDRMVSFYVRAPGGWDIEYGTDGMRVDESHYTAEEITADSYWGHDWSGSEPLAAFAPPE
ncbi:biphenyl-2,3-diol 1,2-dioxygenase [Prauserella halophila]|uniref:Biphenyl-2,3-diol 1,2-dioxygenase n=1 Tax=Prauserella halophila TaxID=185641 RepID=A0ABP4GQI3_9PSEU|nr:VOC family protein [Prauserella halophila]MCP2237420.1 2,3-dihydroxybiphenyl 1,2-dioxygenase [Prauserella halophila]